MGRLYTVTFEGQTVTNAGGDNDLFELDAAAEKPIELVGLELYVTSELGDAAEEWLRLKIIRGHTTSGSTPAVSPTPRPLNPTDAAAGFTAECVNTTIASSGTGVDLWAGGFNVRAGLQLGPLPDGFGFVTSGASLLVVRLMAAPADDVTMSGTAWVIEQG
jgi:hypothetical protein